MQGRKFAFNDKEPLDEQFTKHITAAAGGVFHTNQKPTQQDAEKPFTEQKGFDKENYDNLVRKDQDITDAYYNSAGKPVPQHLVNQYARTPKKRRSATLTTSYCAFFC
mgnify:CR=1 FL=1